MIAEKTKSSNIGRETPMLYPSSVIWHGSCNNTHAVSRKGFKSKFG
jgi:hypothetical protein